MELEILSTKFTFQGEGYLYNPTVTHGCNATCWLCEVPIWRPRAWNCQTSLLQGNCILSQEADVGIRVLRILNQTGHRDPKEPCQIRTMSLMVSDMLSLNSKATCRQWGAVEGALELELDQVPALHFLVGGF